MILVFIFPAFADIGVGTIKVHAAGSNSQKIIEQKFSIAVGHSGAVKEDGSLWMWGFDGQGRLGDGGEINGYQTTPKKIMDDVESVVLGSAHSAAIKKDGSLWLWGNNENGQIGDGTSEHRAEPVKIMDDVISVALGERHTGALRKDGSLWMWGLNAQGQAGAGSNTSFVYEPVKIMEDVASITVGSRNSAAIKSDGSLWVWGDNSKVENGSAKDAYEPIMIMEDVAAVSCSGLSNAVIKSDGSLWTWGYNSTGILGDGTTVTSWEPTEIMDEVRSVSMGSSMAGAVKEDGTLWLWGSGRFGNGASSTKQYTPIEVAQGVSEVYLDSSTHGMIKEDGSLWLWGFNCYGQVGDGTTKDSNIPLEIMPEGSIKVLEKKINTITFPITITNLFKTRVKVLDEIGNPIEGVTITYNNETYETGSEGVVELNNYQQGLPLTLSKWGHEQKTVDKFARSITGCNTYVLATDDTILYSVTASMNNVETDLMTEEMTINQYYKTTEWSLSCKGSSYVYRYELYSGDKKIAESDSGLFAGLKYSDLTAGEDVVLHMLMQQSWGTKVETLNIKVINVNPQMLSLSIGDGFSVKMPKDTPIVGGMKLDLKLESVPVTVEMDGDKMKFGFNVTEIVKQEPESWFSTVQQLNPENCKSFFNAMKKAKKKRSKGDSNTDLQIIGWAEGNVKDPDYFSGKLLVEFTADWYKENQVFPFGIPVVVEVSVEGKINADGSITFTSVEGLSGELSVGGEVKAGLYGGVGIAKFASAGIYGKAGIGLKYDILPEVIQGLNELYIEGEAGVKVKAFGKNLGKLALINGTYYIINNDTAHAVNNLNNVSIDSLSINNNTVYEDINRSYLYENGSMSIQWSAEDQAHANGNVREIVLQDSTYLDIIPLVVTTDDSAMLFYLTDGGSERADADRSQLVYSVYNEADGSWTTPEAVLGDDTADFAPDIYVDGDKVYAVWQNATESLDGELTLNDIADRLTLQAAVYDEAIGRFTDLGAIKSENGFLQQRPQIAADGEEVSVYWYENATDNVLGLSGKNQIYQAILQENAAPKVTAMSETETVYEEETLITEEETEEQTEESTEEESSEPETEEEVEESSEPETEDEVEENSEPETEENSESDVEEPESAFNENSEEMEAVAEEYERTASILQERVVHADTVSGNDITETEESEDEDIEETTDNEEESESESEEPKTEESTSDEEETEEETDSTESATDLESETEETTEETETETETLTEEFMQEDALSVENNGSDTDAWLIKSLKTEKKCIVSAEAGKVNGEIIYAYAAGTVDKSYNVTESSVILISQDAKAETLTTGTPEKLEITEVFGTETLTWFENGDICYVAGDGAVSTLFGESRLPSTHYTLLSDETGNPEVIFPINADGKSDLYRIGYENGAFLNTLAVTAQENYIQYVDGFIDGDETVLVYNQMEVDENLEEVSNSLCTGILEHSYYDIEAQSAGSMIKEDASTGEDVLEITAQIYNNGTVKAEGLTLQLAKADGTVLESAAVDTVLEAGETGYGTAVFSLDNITEEADYTITVIGSTEADTTNNSTTLLLGEASLQMASEVVAVGDTRTLQIGIENTGVTACGGTVIVQDTETGVEYCASEFEAITRGDMLHVEVPVDTTIFDGREYLSLEVTVIPEEGDVISEPVVIYAPTYTICFVTDEGENNVFVSYGNRAAFPANPAKDGAQFIGWYTAENAAEGTLYTEETEILEDVTLYACFAGEEEVAAISLENCSVAPIATQNYTGKALKPAVTVKWGSTVLKVKKDYTVSYSNNKNQGTATVTITGKGNYTGSITRTFDIKYPLSKASIKKITTVNYTGESHTPDITVTYQGKTLKKNKDYTITYTNNRNAGTAGVTITGKGKYTGTKSAAFQIKGISITGMKFDKLTNVVYSGSSEEPFVTVKTKAGVQLRNGADYKTVYQNSVNKGTATVTIIGNGNYTGTKKMTYKILAKPLTKDMVSEIADRIYTGASLKPGVTVTDGDKTLTLGKDYTITYSKNKNAGKATAVISGKGNYSGKISVPFTINKETLENNENVTVKVSDMAYTGRKLKPAVQVYVGNKKLSSQQYTVAYSNNTELGEGTVTVTGKGNYTGSISENFRIVKKASLVSSLKYGKLGSYEYTGEAIEPEVSIMDGEYRLVENTDYTLVYSKQVNAGTASVTISGIGNYAGSKTLTYKITQRVMVSKNIWKDGFTIEEIEGQKYTGYALKPDVVLKDGDKLLEKGKDYKLSYKNNTNIGTGKITVTGIGNYKGSNSAVTFPIVAWEYNNLEATAMDQIYSGSALKPKVTFTLDGKEIVLKTNTAVKIAYSNNKNVGEATITITGKGKLKDMAPITVNFAIEHADLENAVVSKISNQTLKATPVKPTPKVKVGKNSLKLGRDFTVSYLRNGVKGEAEVIITGIGNYTGECRKTFIVQ